MGGGFDFLKKYDNLSIMFFGSNSNRETSYKRIILVTLGGGFDFLKKYDNLSIMFFDGNSNRETFYKRIILVTLGGGLILSLIYFLIKEKAKNKKLLLELDYWNSIRKQKK